MIAAFRSEWIKLRRPTVLLGTLGACLAFTVLATALTFANATDGTSEPVGPGLDSSTVQELSRASGMLAGLAAASQFLGVVALILCAFSVGSEYGQGTLRNLLVREPRRLRLLTGKLAAVGSLLVLAAVTAAPLSALVALLIAPGNGIDVSAWSSAEGLATAIERTAQTALAMLGFGLLGGALGILLRSSVAAIGVGLAYLLPVETVLTGTVSGATAWLPGGLLSTIAEGGSDDVSLLRAATVAGLYATVAVVVCGRRFLRQDVTA